MVDMDPVVTAALIATLSTAVASIPAIIAARRVERVHAEVRTNHGVRSGDYVEGTAFMVGVLDTKLGELRSDFTAHTEQDRENFEALATQIGAHTTRDRQDFSDLTTQIDEKP